MWFLSHEPTDGIRSETVIVLFRLPGQQQALGWMVCHGSCEAGLMRESSTRPTCCSEMCPRALGSLYCNYCLSSHRVPPASDFTCNYPRDKNDVAHPPPSPSSSLPPSPFIFLPSPYAFFPCISQTSPIKSTAGGRGINPKVTFYPSLGLLSPWGEACHVP